MHRMRPEGIGRPHPARAAQFMPFAALRGYCEMVEGRNVAPESELRLTEEEMRGLAERIRRLRRGDQVVAVCRAGRGYEQLEGELGQVDEVFREMRIGSRKVSLDDVIYVAGQKDDPGEPPEQPEG